MKENDYKELKQIDDDICVLYAPASLNFLISPMRDNLNKKSIELNKLFKITCFRKIQINLFDDLEKFRNYIYSIRKETYPLPEYARGTYDSGMINAFIDKNIVTGGPLFIVKTCLAAHELFHIMYMELILDNDYSKRVIWFDEGMAQNFSGEKDYLLDDKKFYLFLKNVMKKTIEYPNLNNIKHGNSFYNENYNGYDLSYICVKYLKETLSIDELSSLMSDFNKIKGLGDTIIKDAFNYFEEKHIVR